MLVYDCHLYILVALLYLLYILYERWLENIAQSVNYLVGILIMKNCKSTFNTIVYICHAE